jgi:hypothetical protein
VHATHIWGLALIARAEGAAIDDALLAPHLSMAQAALAIPAGNSEGAVDDVAAFSLLALYAYNVRDIALGTKWMMDAVTTAQEVGLRISLPLVMNGMHASPESAHTRVATFEEQERDALVNLVIIDYAARMLISTPSQPWEALDQESKALMVSVNASLRSHAHGFPLDLLRRALRIRFNTDYPIDCYLHFL